MTAPMYEDDLPFDMADDDAVRTFYVTRGCTCVDAHVERVDDPFAPICVIDVVHHDPACPFQDVR